MKQGMVDKQTDYFKYIYARNENASRRDLIKHILNKNVVSSTDALQINYVSTLKLQNAIHCIPVYFTNSLCISM